MMLRLFILGAGDLNSRVHFARRTDGRKVCFLFAALESLQLIWLRSMAKDEKRDIGQGVFIGPRVPAGKC